MIFEDMLQKKARHVVASLYATLLHPGHVDYLEAASEAAAGGCLTVIVNNDAQLARKKGTGDSHPFLKERERARIIAALRCVTRAIVSVDDGPSVCRTLAFLHQLHKVDAFANGGDVDTCLEASLCSQLGIECLYGVGGFKVYSSTQMIEAIRR